MSIEDFALRSKDIYGILKQKKVEFLYHANTVGTSITFIENRALLSRHYIETNSLHQTDQKSDKEDKEFDVWDHTFLDGADLHRKYSCANKYGPVLFKLKLELLTSPSLSQIYVTKSNPWYWKKSTKLEDKFYSNSEDIKSDYLTGTKLDSQIMFTFRKPTTEIKLNKYLKSIELDKPKLLVNSGNGSKKNVGDYAQEALITTLKSNGLGHIPISVRHNGKIAFCRCVANYNYIYSFDKPEFVKRFRKK